MSVLQAISSLICPVHLGAPLPVAPSTEDASHSLPTEASWVWWLCLKYSNQPRSVRFTSAMISQHALSRGPLGFCVTESLEIKALVLRQAWTHLKVVAEKSKPCSQQVVSGVQTIAHPA